MLCKNCNAENVENAVFCSSCGTRLGEETPKVAPVAEPAPAPKAAPVPQPVVLQVENKNKIPEEYKPVSPWGYLGLQILYCIPIIGFIFLLVHTFSDGNLNRRNYARSYWCALLVGIIFAVVCVIVMLLLTLIGINVADMAYAY